MLYLGHTSLWFLVLLIGALVGKTKGDPMDFIFFGFIFAIPSTIVHLVFFGG